MQDLLVNPKLLEYTKDICTIYNSAKMTLEEVLSVMEKAEAGRQDNSKTSHR